MLAVAAFAVIFLAVIGGMAWTARILRIANLDALALAEKIATPMPASPVDWPELRLRAVVPQPEEPSLILLLVEWPAHRRLATVLLAATDSDRGRPLDLLSRWCASQASVAPTRRGPGEIQLRRRQSLERVSGLLVADDIAPPSFASGRPRPNSEQPGA